MKLTILFVFLLLLINDSEATVSIKFDSGAQQERFSITTNQLSYTATKEKKVKTIDKEIQVEFETKLLAIYWDSKKMSDSLKTKCVPYMEIIFDEEPRTVCAQDRTNRNKAFTILNSLKKLATE